MSKKKSGLLIAFGAILGGAVAAGISYYLKLKSFNDELDQDFHEYEEDDTPAEETEKEETPAPERTYITINSGKTADASAEPEPAAEEEETPEECPASEDSVETASETVSGNVEGAPEENPSSAVVEDDTEEEKAE